MSLRAVLSSALLPGHVPRPSDFRGTEPESQPLPSHPQRGRRSMPRLLVLQNWLSTTGRTTASAESPGCLRHPPVCPAPHRAPPSSGAWSPRHLLSPPLLSLCRHRQSLNAGAHQALPRCSLQRQCRRMADGGSVARTAGRPASLSSVTWKLPPSTSRPLPTLVLAERPAARSLAPAARCAGPSVLLSSPGHRAGS